MGPDREPQDPVGAETLERLAGARNYNRGLTDRLQRWVGRRVLGHVRRYTPRELREKYDRVGFRVAHLEYFNLFGIPGWWFAGRVLRRRIIPAGSLGLYDALVPLFRLERFLPWRLGQSLIAIGERA